MPHVCQVHQRLGSFNLDLCAFFIVNVRLQNSKEILDSVRLADHRAPGSRDVGACRVVQSFVEKNSRKIESKTLLQNRQSLEEADAKYMARLIPL